MGFNNSGNMDIAGGIIKGTASVAAGDEKAQLDRANENIAGVQAKSEMEAGAFNADQLRRKAAITTGAQVSAIGANNLQQGGTPAQVVASTARSGELSAIETNNNALRRAWGFQVQGASDASQANMAERGGLLSGIGAVEGGFGAAMAS